MRNDGTADPAELCRECPELLDELRRRIEVLKATDWLFEPEPDDEPSLEEHAIQRGALARARSERQIIDAITAARTNNIPWSRIGQLLGTSAQAAQQRYGNIITTN